MRPIDVAFVVTLMQLSAFAAGAQRQITLEDTKKIAELDGQLLSVDGVAEQWLTKGQGDSSFYRIKDNFGSALTVRTVRPRPEPGTAVHIVGMVQFDRETSTWYFDERSRDSLAPTVSPFALGAGGLGLALIAGAVLLLRPRRAASAPTGVANSPEPPPPASSPSPGVNPLLEKTVKVERPEFAFHLPAVDLGQTIPAVGGVWTLKSRTATESLRLFRIGDDVPTYTIGRADGPPLKHVKISDPTVSAQQATLEFTDHGFVITNVSTTNHTIVDGTKLKLRESAPVRDGSVIMVGNVELRYQEPRTSG